MTGYCFDTDVLSAVLRRDPPMHLIRRLAMTAPSDQATTAITMGELLYGAVKKGSPDLMTRVRDLLASAVTILPFDASAAEIYGRVRAELEAGGHPLAEPDLRIAAIALAHGMTLVTANVRHFSRVEELPVENWLEDAR